MKDGRTDASGKSIPLGTLRVDSPQTDRAACMMALDWLRDHHHISSGDYLHEAGKLLAKASSHPQQYAEKPEKDCLE